MLKVCYGVPIAVEISLMGSLDVFDEKVHQIMDYPTISCHDSVDPWFSLLGSMYMYCLLRT